MLSPVLGGNVPSPQDVFFGWLVLLGAPAALVFAITFAIALWEWGKFGGQVVSTASRLMQVLQPWTATTTARVASLVISQSLLLSLGYVFSVLFPAMFVDDVSGQSFADGKTYTISEVVATVFQYHYWTPFSKIVVLASIIGIILVDVACLNRLTGLWVLIQLIGFLLAFAALVLGIITAIGSCSVSSLATQGDELYSGDMTHLYLLWIGLLFGLALCLVWVRYSAVSLFQPVFKEPSPY